MLSWDTFVFSLEPVAHVSCALVVPRPVCFHPAQGRVTLSFAEVCTLSLLVATDFLKAMAIVSKQENVRMETSLGNFEVELYWEQLSCHNPPPLPFIPPTSHL